MSIIEISNLILIEVTFTAISFIGILYIILNIQDYLIGKERNSKEGKGVNS